MYCSGQNTTTVPCDTKAPHILSHLEAICGQKCHIEDGPLGQLLRTIATLMTICVVCSIIQCTAVARTPLEFLVNQAPPPTHTHILKVTGRLFVVFN